MLEFEKVAAQFFNRYYLKNRIETAFAEPLNRAAILQI